jgi:hypothetical protein
MIFTGELKATDQIPSKKSDTNGFGFELPNGKYRFTFKLSSNRDSNLFFLQWQAEVRIRLNDEEF